MGKLIYSMIVSLDGYVADSQGRFDWGEPDEELHAFINEVTAGVGTYLYGRRMYEIMLFWETVDLLSDEPQVQLEWARMWQAANKVVYSSTLERPQSERTRLERVFDPEAVRQLKMTSERDLTVDGPGLASAALRAGLVDEISVYVAPLAVGGGTPFYPAGVTLDLDLLDERRFGNGVVNLRYQVCSVDV